MTGGLLHLIAGDNNSTQNTYFTGNPSKSFFYSKYVKYTNFGFGKYRLDQIGQKEIDKDIETKFTFEVKRYGDLLMDIYLVLKLPNIWSPIYTQIQTHDGSETTNKQYLPYEFRWIKNIGTQIIKEVSFDIDGRTIQKYSGSYIQNMVERDFTKEKKEVFNDMIGNVTELNDPANFSDRNNNR